MQNFEAAIYCCYVVTQTSMHAIRDWLSLGIVSVGLWMLDCHQIQVWKRSFFPAWQLGHTSNEVREFLWNTLLEKYTECQFTNPVNRQRALKTTKVATAEKKEDKEKSRIFPLSTVFSHFLKLWEMTVKHVSALQCNNSLIV